MHGTPSLPTWMLALLVAFVAPFMASAIGRAFERQARSRTVRALASIGSNGRAERRSSHVRHLRDTQR